MHSSKGPMVISLSGRGTLGSVSSALEHLTMSLSAQVNPGPLLSVQEARGSCLSLQGNLEGCTCTPGKPGISNASPGALEISASTIVSLGPSPSVQLDLKVSHSVLMSRRPSLSAQGVLPRAYRNFLVNSRASRTLFGKRGFRIFTIQSRRSWTF